MMKNAKLLRTLVLAAVLVMLAVLPVMAMASSAPTVTTADRYLLVGGENCHLWLYNDELAEENDWFGNNATGAELNAAYTFAFEAESGIETVESRTQFTDSGAKPYASIRISGAEAEGKKVTCTMPSMPPSSSMCRSMWCMWQACAKRLPSWLSLPAD